MKMKYLRSNQFFVGTPLVYLAPALLGWGLDDLAGFFSLYPRLGYTVLVVLLGFVAAYQAVAASVLEHVKDKK
jgi:hypothetical protein